MPILAITFVSILLIAISAVMVLWHLAAWQRAAQAGLGEEELAFAWRQCRRRVQASGMIGTIGLAMLAGQFIPVQWPFWFGLFWLAIVLAVLWVLLLAMADIVSTQQHFGRLRRRDMAEQTRLQAQLRRHRHQGNGRHGNGKSVPADEEAD